MTEIKFPKGFLWGAATAAHQVEGNQNNNWSRWEPTVAKHFAQTASKRLESKVPDWGLIKAEAEDPDNYISGRAVDHYSRYEEDFDILGQLNLSAYRFSIEWSRIEPEPGKYNEQEIAHYRQVITALRKRGIEPFVSLHHFTNPAWLDRQGGWHDKKVIERFAAYAEKLASSFGDSVKYWSTINEPTAYIFMRYLDGVIWPGWPLQENNFIRAQAAKKNFRNAHKLAYEKIKAVNPEAQVGIDHGIVWFEAANFMAKVLPPLLTKLGGAPYLNAYKEHLDYVGLHYYMRNALKFIARPPFVDYEVKNDGPMNDGGFEVYPEGIYLVSQEVKKLNKPMYITENGLPDARDKLRADFIEEHLRWLHKSIEDGADIRGYFHWSLLDNLEWSEGYWQKFGLIEVDRKTMKRTVRPSAKVYGQIAKHNGFNYPER